MKRSINSKDVSKSKFNSIKSGTTKNSQLGCENKSKKIIELKSGKSNELQPKPSLPKTRKEEKIIQKKQKVQYLDNYQYHEIKDIKDKNPNRVSIVTHQRLGAIGVLHEKANFQKQTMTDSGRGSQKLTKTITSTDAKDSAKKTLTQNSNLVSQILDAQSRAMIKEAQKYSSNNNLKNDSKNQTPSTKTIKPSPVSSVSSNTYNRGKVSNKKIYETLELEDEIVDSDKQFTIGYSKELDNYYMKILVWWVALYSRWYKITKDDFSLYKKDKRAFYRKYKKELEQNSLTCFNENFIGAECLRDYDGANNFHRLKPSKNGSNSFIGYAYIDNVFYAVIEWKDKTVYVPPVQAINNKFPLRDNCKLYEIDGQPACYVKL